MPLPRPAAAALLAFTLFCGAARAQMPVLDAAMRGQLIDTLRQQLNDYYVFPEVAAKMDAALRARQREGGYDGITDATIFANVLSADLRAFGHDKHLRVHASETALPHKLVPSPERQDEMRRQMAARGYGVAKVEILGGNVGYLDMQGFFPVEDAAPAITAAMTRLADCDALILDMRANGGGDPAGVAFLSSYLFEQRTHLNDLYWREGNRTQQFWTDTGVPGKRYGQHKPVYVLTGPRTFSGAEEFSYNLQQLKRATLVGETTGGGANPGRMRELGPHFAAFIPNGRAINPVSKSNWEGSGVTPDIGVPAGAALETAHRLALQRLAEARGRGE